MSRYINVAAIHFQVEENLQERKKQSAFNQFHEAEKLLDHTGVDLVVTCEGMESVAQTIDDAETVSHPGPVLSMYQEFAARNKCTLAGSLKLKENLNVYNALVFIGPDGKVLGDYRKVFLTDGEIAKGLACGKSAKTTVTPAGILGGIICFDLNFDELRDQYAALRPDILCFSSMFHGAHLQPNWAFKCRSFMAAACKDNSSDITDPLGRTVASANFYGRIARAKINIDRFVMHQNFNITLFPDVLRKYKNEVYIDASPALGTAVLYSMSEKHTARSIAGEFGLIEIDDFFSAGYAMAVRNRR